MYWQPIQQPIQQPAYNSQQQTQQIEEEPEEKSPKSKKIGLIVIGILSVFVLGTCGICMNSISKSSSTAPLPSVSTSSSSTNTGLTSEESTYLTTVSANIHNVGDALQSLTEMCLNPKIGNAEWEVTTGACIGALRLFINQGKGITAPSRMVNIQDKYVEGLNHFYTMTTYLDQGIKKLDSNLINQGTVEMNLGKTCIDEATELVKNFKP